METLSVSKLEENYLYTGCMCGIYGFIFTFCLYKNLSGVTFPVIVAVTIATAFMFLKRMGITVKKNFYIYAAGMMLLGISTPLTMNKFFHFFNWIGIILLFMSGMIQQVNEQGNWSFQKYMVSILMLAGKTIASVCDPFIHGIRYRKNRVKKESRYFKPIILGCACAAGLLVIVLPLLVYSDKIFAVFFGRFTGWFRFGAELGVILTFLAGYILMYAFLSGISALNIKEKENVKQLSLNSVTGITFSGILAVIYVFYSAIQILFLFLRFESGLPESVTYSQYAHAGFWQLLAVSIINFITVLICVSIFEENRILKIILMIISVCTCIMTLSAAYRMILYVRAYHLTFLRVLVLWFLGVLLLIMLGVMLSIIRKKFQLFKYIMVVVAVCYIALSFTKVDKLTAQYNVRHWEQISEVDMMHLMFASSLDTAPVVVQAAEKAVGNPEYWDGRLEQYFQWIQKQDMSLRTWNFSKASAKEAAAEYLR
ncbi:Uncharacterised protein [[Eubacterium] contortum]|uniref:Uncharacterized protein n=1 Tax=Faecalicatena contorta TaxID=39482 RepID=A0A174EK26_9FIRM|nr:DUF4173 domain-containing protein [Faecalicatena contorta]CUO36749.1 Uncharacterised protein [[Eubacterium] contortum] [Faecalicatena contorta]